MRLTYWPLLLLSLGFFCAKVQGQTSQTYGFLMQNVLIEADLFSSKAEIMTANYGFEGIMGVTPFTEDGVIAAGGAWQVGIVCTVPGLAPPTRAITAAAPPSALIGTFGYPVVNLADAMPVVFSWPVLPETVEAKDFQLTLNTGDVVYAQVASISPNDEYNERQTVVIFGYFGNRLTEGPDALYPVSLTIVDSDNTPMQLFGPAGAVDATGLTASCSNPYLPNAGPTLVAAKLSYYSSLGEGAPVSVAGMLPNDGESLYGDVAKFRLRTYTSGGFSINGVSPMFPTDFETFFYLKAVHEFGHVLEITRTGIAYDLGPNVGSLTVIGLADLGQKAGTLDGNGNVVYYDDCYASDTDNYIDIIIDGDESAVARITHVEIPAVAPYFPFYNPGGPGNYPTEGVKYTSPGPPDSQVVINALGDSMTVTYYENYVGAKALGPITSSSDGWSTSTWFGDFYSADVPLVWADGFNWIYPVGNYAAGVYIWSFELGWLWTSQPIYPSVWNFTQERWMTF